MTNLRAPLTFAMAMTRIGGLLDFDDAARIVGRSNRCVRSWSEPGGTKRPTVEQALKLDAAYLAAGGDSAPFLDAFAFQLQVRRARHAACQRALVTEIAQVAQECGDAVAASLELTASGASPRTVHRAVAEAEEAHKSTGALLRRLTSFLSFGAGPGAGITGGTHQ